MFGGQPSVMTMYRYVSFDDISPVVFPLHMSRVVTSSGLCMTALIDIGLLPPVNLLNASDISFHMSTQIAETRC